MVVNWEEFLKALHKLFRGNESFIFKFMGLIPHSNFLYVNDYVI